MCFVVGAAHFIRFLATAIQEHYCYIELWHSRRLNPKDKPKTNAETECFMITKFIQCMEFRPIKAYAYFDGND